MSRRRTQGGFVMITAVFILVIVAMLAVMIVSLSATQQVGQVRELYGTAARYAARSGIEWALYKVARSGTCTATETLPPLAGSAAGFTVVANCAVYGPYDEDGQQVRVYQLTSTATRGTLGQVDFVERQMSASISQP